jgi:hypothetical protein
MRQQGCGTTRARSRCPAFRPQVALEVKKTLVDGDLLDVSQAQLEGVIFRVMRKRAFGDDFVSRYRMLTAFHMKRSPLIVLICGSVCTGKSTIAAKLSQVRCLFTCIPTTMHCRTDDATPAGALIQRLNLPNTVQTDVVCQVCRWPRRLALQRRFDKHRVWTPPLGTPPCVGPAVLGELRWSASTAAVGCAGRWVARARA